MIYERGNVANSIIPFDKDKLVVVELSNGSITDELPFKDGVQSLPVMKNDISTLSIRRINLEVIH